MSDIAKLGFQIDSAPLRRAGKDLDNFSTKSGQAGGATTKMGSTAKAGFAKVAVAAAAAYGAVRLLSGSITTISQFDESMAKLSAISGATATELSAMRDVAKELGSTTEFSAKQASDGLSFLAMAGFNAKEALATIPAVLDLATASGMGLAEAADTTSNIMSGFGIAAENASKVTDVLAKASSSANTTVSQLGSAMSTVAPISSALGIGLEGTAAAIGIMSDAGIQGERAGTALRGTLASLARPTTAAEEVLAKLGLSIADVNPATNELSDIMAKLGTAGISTADAMEIFGREAASGALVLVKGADQLKDFSAELGVADGAAGGMATTMRDTLGGDIKSMQSAFAGLTLELGEAGLGSVLRSVVQGITNIARKISEGIKVIDEYKGYIIAFGIALAISYTPAMIAATTSTAAFIAGLVTMKGALLATGIGALVVGAGYLLQKFMDLSDEVGGFNNAIAHLEENNKFFRVIIGLVRGIKNTFLEAKAGVESGITSVGNFMTKVTEGLSTFTNKFDGVGGIVSKALGVIIAPFSKLKEIWDEVMELFTGQGTLGDRLKAFANDMVNILVLDNPVVKMAQGLANAVKTPLNAVIKLFENMVNKVLTTINDITSFSIDVPIYGKLSVKGTDLKPVSFPAFRDGGYVSGEGTGTSDSIMARLSNGEFVMNARATAKYRGMLDAMNAGNLPTFSTGGAVSPLKTTKAHIRLNKEIKFTVEQLERIEAITKNTRTPLEEYNAKVEELNELFLDGTENTETYNRALSKLQNEYAENSEGFKMLGEVIDGVWDKSLNGMGDFVARGKQMLSGFLQDMTKKFARSLFVPNIGGANIGSTLGSVGNMASSASSASSLMSFAGMGSKLSAMGGGTGFFGGLGGAVSGGMSGMFSGAGISGAATAAGGGAMATIGAAVPVVLAVAAAVSFFKSKTKELDNGLRLTAKGADLAVESFRDMEKKKFWGMSKKRYSTYSDADAEIADPFIEAFSNVYSSIENGANALGVSSRAFDGFTDTIKVSLKGLSDQEQAQAISQALTGFGDKMANLIPSLSSFALQGETSTATLNRLTTSLSVVNDVFDTLGHSAFQGSLAGANMAYELSRMMGGLEAFTAKSGAYYDAFYTDAEKLENQTGRLTEALAGLGLQLPTSTQAFRDLVDGSIAIGDLDIAASLIELAPAFKAMSDASDAAAKSANDLARAEAEAARIRDEEYQTKLAQGRDKYGLKTEGFRTSFESKRAEDMARKERSSNQLIEEQNALARIANDLLQRLNTSTQETNRAIDEQNNNVVVT